MTSTSDRERRPVDLRTFASREDALAAPAASEHALELICVRDLHALVDRNELLSAPTTEEPPYWALPWIGARAIAARVLSHGLRPHQVVLDLGCGLGLSGVAAGLSGARVTFVDRVDAALDFARINAALHGIEHDTVSADFTRDRLERRFDWILAADVVYDPSHYAALVDFLDAHLAPQGTLLLTESLRADARRVLELLSERNIRGSAERVWLLEEGHPEVTWLHTLSRADHG